MSNDSLGDRMKGYENVPRISLMRRTPVILRADGKAFHTLTGRHCVKPFDVQFQSAMWATAKNLCENVQGVRVAYVQSDEISVLMTDWTTLDTQGWFDYQLQKMVSVAAAFASVAFNKAFPKADGEAVFDARAFNIPAHEVQNYFVWRQQDATRNSINSVGQANFPHKALHGLNTDQVQELLFKEKGINWNDLAVCNKRGVCLFKKTVPFTAVNKKTGDEIVTTRSAWDVDMNIPVFTQDKEYINKFMELPV